MMDQLETQEWRETSAFGLASGGTEGVQHLPRCPFGAGDCYPTQPEKVMVKLLKPCWK